MFLSNQAKDDNDNPKDVHLSSHAGFAFILPPGISAIWDSAGKEILKIYKPETEDSRPPKFQRGVNIGGDGGALLPAVMESNEKEWEKDGKKLAEVIRFKIKHELLPRAALLKKAREYGVAPDRVMEFVTDGEIDKQIIAEEINKLPVPDKIKYPVNIEDEPVKNNETPTETDNETRKKIKEKLDSLKIEYDGRAGTDALLETLMNAQNDKPQKNN